MDFDGILAHSVGKFIATGHGRGIGLLMIMEGIVMLFVSIVLLTYFYSRHINEELLTYDLKIDSIKIQ